MSFCQYRERRERAVHARDNIGKILVKCSLRYLWQHSYWYELPAVLWGRLMLGKVWFPAVDMFLREPTASDHDSYMACAACGLTFELFPAHVQPCAGCRNELTLKKAGQR